jgi:hypothetical protein
MAFKLIQFLFVKRLIHGGKVDELFSILQQLLYVSGMAIKVP